MEKLRFNKHKYGKEFLIDSVDMDTFEQASKTLVTDFYCLGFMRKASGQFQIGHQKIALQDGHCLCVPPGSIVHFPEAEMEDAIWLFFNAGFLEVLFNERGFIFKLDYFHHPGIPNYLSCQDNSQSVYPLFEEIHREIHSNLYNSEDLLRATLYYLLLKLNKNFQREHPKEKYYSDHPVLMRVKQYLGSHAIKYKTVSQLAAQLQIGTKRLNAICQERLGKTAKEVLSDFQIAEIKQQLMASDLDIQQLCYSMGYSDPGNFTRFFKRNVGESPEQFRNRFSK